MAAGVLFPHQTQVAQVLLQNGLVEVVFGLEVFLYFRRNALVRIERSARREAHQDERDRQNGPQRGHEPEEPPAKLDADVLTPLTKEGSDAQLVVKLRKARSLRRAEKYDEAITLFKELSQRKDSPLPVDGILMQLGRVYIDAGKRADAQQTFNRLVEEYPESPFIGDARKEIENLKKT